MRPATLPPIAVLGGSKAHGTRLRYMSGCRCTPCRAANSRYECERLAERKAGRSNKVVSAGTARAHIARLRAAGLGTRTIGDMAGVGRTIVMGIARGVRPRCRQKTVRAICEVSPFDALPGAYVDAAHTWRLIGELLEAGWTRGRIAQVALGWKCPALQLSKTRCTKAHADAIAALWLRELGTS